MIFPFDVEDMLCELLDYASASRADGGSVMDSANVTNREMDDMRDIVSKYVCEALEHEE